MGIVVGNRRPLIPLKLLSLWIGGGYNQIQVMCANTLYTNLLIYALGPNSSDFGEPNNDPLKMNE